MQAMTNAQLSLPAPAGIDPVDVTDALVALHDRQRDFVLAYVGNARGNAERAAQAAGYANPNRDGSRLLRDGRIRAAIAELLEPLITPSLMVLRELNDIALASYPDVYACIDKDGNMDWAKLNESGLTHVVKSITRTRQGIKIELHDKLEALRILARYHGLLINQSKSMNINIEGMSMEQLAALASGRDPTSIR